MAASSRYSLNSTLSSSTYTASTTSGDTIPGPGALSGKAILALGKLTLRGAEYIIIRRRLNVIASTFPLTNTSSVNGVERLYDDLLELSRLDMYPKHIRNRAMQIVLVQIATRGTEDMIKSLLKWPDVEIQIFISQLVTMLDPIQLSRPATQNDAGVKAYQASLSIYESHSLSPLLDFFGHLAWSLGPTQAPSLLQSNLLDFLLHLYVTNFRDPLASTDRSSVHRTSTLQAACSVLLASCCEAKSSIEIICDHPLHCLWPMRPEMAFTVHLPERADRRMAAWNSAPKTLILWWLHSIFDMTLQSARRIHDSILYDVCADLLELSGGKVTDSEIKIRALRSLHRVFTSGNPSTQWIIQNYFASCSLTHSIEILSEIVQQLSCIISPDTPESKIFFLQWDQTFLISNAVLHFLHLFLVIGRRDETFLTVALNANVLGLTRPFLEIELFDSPDVHMTPGRDGDSLITYNQADSVILARIKEHGLKALLPDPPTNENVNPTFFYRRSMLGRAFDVFLGRGEETPGSSSPSPGSSQWDDLPSSLDGSDHAALWIGADTSDVDPLLLEPDHHS